MRHVAPHRWADAWAGKLDDSEIAEMDAHAEDCPRCAKARDRITRASSTTFPALRSESAPDIGWDAVRARVYWTTSTERRAKLPRRRFAVVGFAVAGAAVAAGFGLWASGFRSETTKSPESSLAEARSLKPEASPETSAAQPVYGLVTRSSGETMVKGVREGAFDTTLKAGDTIATGAGRIDIQFGDASALALGPQSSLTLEKLDSEGIELAVDGTIDVVVAPRAPGQHFYVLAGDETVEVRGTQFRVARDGGGIRVQCAHGLVAVRDGAGAVNVAAAHQAVVLPGRAGDAHAAMLADSEIAQLVADTPVTLPAWTSADALAKTSAPLEIASAAARDVRLDGVELGAAPLHVRVMPGRHTVEAADRAGRYHRSGWVDVSTQKIARLEIQPADEATPKAGTGSAERKKQLHAGLDRGKLDACTRALFKEGIAGAFVQIEIAVDASGAVNYLNALDSDLGAAGQDCVLGVLRGVRFAPGAPASWRERIDL